MTHKPDEFAGPEIFKDIKLKLWATPSGWVDAVTGEVMIAYGPLKESKDIRHETEEIL